MFVTQGGKTTLRALLKVLDNFAHISLLSEDGSVENTTIPRRILSADDLDREVLSIELENFSLRVKLSGKGNEE